MLDAMRRGRTAFGQNPADATRAFQRRRRSRGHLYRAVTAARAAAKKR